MIRFSRRIIFASALLLCAALALWRFFTPMDAGRALMTSQLPDLAGKPQHFKQWQGKIVIFNYWAPWCPPCRKEIPELAAISREFIGKNVQVVGISLDSADSVRAFATPLDIPYPLLIAPMEVLEKTENFGNISHTLPFTVIIDPEGTTRYVSLKTVNRSDLAAIIQQITR